MENLKNVTDHFKDRVFTVGSAIGEGKISHPAKVLASYNYLCFVEITKAYTTGPFKEYGIYNVSLLGDGTEFLSEHIVDYETNPNAPARRTAPDDEVKQMYDTIVGKMKLRFFEDGLRDNTKFKEADAVKKAEDLRMENIAYIKSRQLEIYNTLTELCKGLEVKKLASDKKIIALVGENNLLEALKKFATK
jgi:hypothetical protein